MPTPDSLQLLIPEDYIKLDKFEYDRNDSYISTFVEASARQIPAYLFTYPSKIKVQYNSNLRASYNPLLNEILLSLPHEKTVIDMYSLYEDVLACLVHELSHAQLMAFIAYDLQWSKRFVKSQLAKERFVAALRSVGCRPETDNSLLQLPHWCDPNISRHLLQLNHALVANFILQEPDPICRRQLMYYCYVSGILEQVGWAMECSEGNAKGSLLDYAIRPTVLLPDFDLSYSDKSKFTISELLNTIMSGALDINSVKEFEQRVDQLQVELEWFYGGSDMEHRQIRNWDQNSIMPLKHKGN